MNHAAAQNLQPPGILAEATAFAIAKKTAGNALTPIVV
jgi:hypothetical protein